MTLTSLHNLILDAVLFECDPQHRKDLAHQHTDELLEAAEPYWKHFCPTQLPKEDSGAINSERDPQLVSSPKSSGTNKGD